jgi:hypothetical protein
MNRSTNAGAFHDTDAEGRYRLELQATVGDSVSLWYEIDGNVSEAVEFQIRQP